MVNFRNYDKATNYAVAKVVDVFGKDRWCVLVRTNKFAADLYRADLYSSTDDDTYITEASYKDFAPYYEYAKNDFFSTFDFCSHRYEAIIKVYDEETDEFISALVVADNNEVIAQEAAMVINDDYDTEVDDLYCDELSA